jgi:hypothetical protein
MSCVHWIAFVTTLVSPPLTSGCSRVRATAEQISKSEHPRGEADQFAGGRHCSPQSQWHRSQWADSRLRMGRLKASSATPTTRTTSSRAQHTDKIRNYPNTYCLNRHVASLPVCMSTSGRIHGELAIDLLPIQQTGRRLFCGPWLSAAQTGVLSQSLSLLPAKQGHHWDGLCSGCVVAWRPHHSASPLSSPSQSASPPHTL